MVGESRLAANQRDPAPRTASPGEAGVETLGTGECWRLVESSRLGRLALEAVDGRPDVFPLNFLVHDGSLYIRSAPGTKLRSIQENPAVAFEIDGTDDRFHWSVVIRGVAERMTREDDIAGSGVLGLVSWSPTYTPDFVRLVPSTITGRRFPRQLRRTWIGPVADASGIPRASTAHLPPSLAAPALEREPGKPRPIPHFPPLPH